MREYTPPAGAYSLAVFLPEIIRLHFNIRILRLLPVLLPVPVP